MPLPSDLPHPAKLLRPAWWISAFAFVWVAFAWFVFPPAIIPALALVVVCGAMIWPMGRVLNRRKEDLAALNKQPTFFVPSAGYPQKAGSFYIGKGYHIKREHLQMMYDLAGLDSDEVNIDQNQVGDPKLLGVGHRSISNFFLPLSALNHMVGVWGATGYGKTRFAENVIVQAIRDPEAPCAVYFDPKGDDQLRRRLAEEASKAGRPFYWFSLAKPDECDTYSPIARFNDPTELQGRLSALIPKSESARHWQDYPLGTAVTVASIRHYIKELLEAYGGTEKTSARVLCAFEALRNNRDLTASEALAKADEITLPAEYAPAAWYPDLMALYHLGSVIPHVLFAWMLRLRYPWAANHEPDAPSLASADGVKDSQAAWQKLGNTPQPSKVSEVLSLAGVDYERIKSACDGLDKFYPDLQSSLEEDSEQRIRNNSGLKTGLSLVRGVSSAINSPNPTIRWEKVIDEGAVVFVELNALQDEPAAETVGKMMLSDLAAYVGHTYAHGLGRRPFFGVIDEVSNVICQPLVNLLNKGRGGGVHLMIMGQGIADITKGLNGDEPAARQVIQNLNTSIQLATRDLQQAKAVSESVERVRVLQTTQGTTETPSYDQTAGAGHIGNFSAGSSTNYSSQEVPVFPAHSFQALPKGQALVNTDGKSYLVQAALLKETDFDFDEFWTRRQRKGREE